MSLLINFRRKFAKELGRIIFSKDKKHNIHLWPYVKISRDEEGYISALSGFGQDLPLINLSEIQNIISSDINIVLSGPSIKNIDYSKLSHLKFLGVNGSIVLSKNGRINFDYYCVVDRSFIVKRLDLIKQITKSVKYFFITPDVARYILEHIDIGLCACEFVIIEDIFEKAYQKTLNYDDLNKIKNNSLYVFNKDPLLGFSMDPSFGWFDADTVAYTCLQLAVWGKVKTVCFHGLDMKFSNNQKRFYENSLEEGPKSRIEQNFDEIIKPSFLGAALLLQDKINMFNLSDNTAISYDVIPFKDWRTLCV